MTQGLKKWWNDTNKKQSGESLYCEATEIAHTQLRKYRDNVKKHIRACEPDPTGYSNTTSPLHENVASTNLAAEIVDTLAAEVTSKRPQADIVPENSDWTIQQKVRKMNAVVDGEFHANEVWDIAPLVFRDGLTTGLGALKVTSRNGYPCIERVTPGELIVDPTEVYYANKPHTLYQLRPYSKEVLKHKLSVLHKGKLPASVQRMVEDAEAAPNNYFDFLPTHANYEDYTLVVEGWRLPDDKDSPGKHMVAIGTGTLFEEEWTRPRFPFAFYRWSPRTFGFYSRSVVEEIYPYQKQLDEANRRIQEALFNFTNPKYLVRKDSGITIKRVKQNVPGQIIEVPDPAAVVLKTENPVSEQLFMHASQIVDKAFEQVGLTRERAVSQAPARAATGAAIREFSDFGAKRLSQMIQAYDRLFEELAKVVIDEKQHLAKRGMDKPTRVEVARGQRLRFDELTWKDISVDEYRYKVRVGSSSALPSSPAGRTRVVQAWANSGWISSEQAMRLLDIQDLDRHMQMQYADHEIIMYHMDVILHDETPIKPLSTQNLQLTKRLVQAFYNKAMQDNIPVHLSEMVLRYLQATDFLIQQTQQQQMQQQMEAQMMAQQQAQAQQAPQQAPQAPQGPQQALPPQQAAQGPQGGNAAQ